MCLEFEQLNPQDLIPLRLGLLYERGGYQKYRMSRFEAYSLYQENQGFLPSSQVITFTDLDGQLLALKPDVTLSIAKNAQPQPGECKKYYYSENVYRPSQESHAFQEISQMGLECIGAVDAQTMAQNVNLALESLGTLGGEGALIVGHMGFVTGLLDAVGVPQELRAAVLEGIRDKRTHELRRFCGQGGLSEAGARSLCRLVELGGQWEQVLEQAKALAITPCLGKALAELEQLYAVLHPTEKIQIRLDLSLVNDIQYYNGLVFQGYLAGLPRPILQGGRYDPLAARFSPGAKAIGFALYLNELSQSRGPQEASKGASPEFLNIALPKGRLGEKVYKLLSESGYGCEEDFSNSRKLTVENPQAGVRYFWVKPSDVAIYVEHGAADIGIVGKDVLDESRADVYELLDTGLGRCQMCVAGPKGFQENTGRTLRVATKFPNIAKRYYGTQARDIDIIKLNGSIELAPLVGLSDVIVDIVETGTTLRENGLEVLKSFLPISARLIANKSSYQFKRDAIDSMMRKMFEVTNHD